VKDKEKDKKIVSKEKLLNDAIKQMLEGENPLEGIYGMYGDHPDTGDIYSRVVKSDGHPKAQSAPKSSN